MILQYKLKVEARTEKNFNMIICSFFCMINSVSRLKRLKFHKYWIGSTHIDQLSLYRTIQLPFSPFVGYIYIHFTCFSHCGPNYEITIQIIELLSTKLKFGWLEELFPLLQALFLEIYNNIVKGLTAYIDNLSSTIISEQRNIKQNGKTKKSQI